MGKRRAPRQNKANQQKKKQPFGVESGSARMHMLHNGPNISPYMETLMRKAIENPSKDTLTIPVMETIQRRMGNQFAVTLIQRAMAGDNSDYGALRQQFDPEYTE